jgi:hypothetical protein
MFSNKKSVKCSSAVGKFSFLDFQVREEVAECEKHKTMSLYKARSSKYFLPRQQLDRSAKIVI